MDAPDQEVPWHSLDVAEVFDDLSTQLAGLSESEAALRLEFSGANELETSKPASWWFTAARQFASPLIGILLGAAVITAILQKWIDMAAILVVLFVNAAIGFLQERRAASEVRALARLSDTQCRVVREGREHVVSARVLVPGDVVRVTSGDRIPADLRFVETVGLQVDESMLTGEATPVSKSSGPVATSASVSDRRSLGFSGTFVVAGRGVGLVVETGPSTEIGRINALVQDSSPTTPLQQLVHRLEARIGFVVAGVSALVLLIGIVRGDDLAVVFLSAVALAVASIPEALPIVLTIALSIGVSRMARHNAILRSLPAVETLGSTTVICSDKTGTLTQNQLTVERFWTPNGVTVLSVDDSGDSPAAAVDPLLRGAARAGGLANEAHESESARAGFIGDAVDVAMALAAVRWGGLSGSVICATPEFRTPYEPELGYSQSVRVEADGTRTLYVKGAPEVIAGFATNMRTIHGDEPIDLDEVALAGIALASEGFRVIATAERPLSAAELADRCLPPPRDLTLLGLAGMADPPRPGVARAVSECQDAGVSVVMLTGDHPATAEAIADRLGIPRRAPAVTGSEIVGLDDFLLLARLRESGVAARVSPRDKLRIVNVLQRAGEIAAVTGDGVNDAPALKAAAIGVAMGASGTDVARESADIVLTDDNFSTIVAAVRQGRATFAAIRKATYFLLSTAGGIIIAVIANALLDQPLLFLPLQVLWINLVTNGLQDVALAFEPEEGDELQRPPRSSQEGLLSRALWARLALTAVWMGALVLLAFAWGLAQGLGEEHARSLALTLLVTLNFFQAGSARAEHRSLFRISPLSNPFLLITATGSLILHWGVMSWSVSAGLLGLHPISALEWIYCLALGSTVLAVAEIEKGIRRRLQKA